METELKCPNCGTPAAAGSKGRIVCTSCGGTFEFAAGEHKLVGVGDFDKLAKDVEDLKAKVAAPPADPVKPAADDDDTDGDSTLDPYREDDPELEDDDYEEDL